MTRDIATKFNNEYGEIFTLPEHVVNEDVATIPGIDGQKMSKSYDNAIDIFMETEKKLQKRCNKIVSSSTPLGEPLEYEGCNIYNLASLFLDDDRKVELQARYKTGEEGYGHFKQYLKGLIWDEFSEAREKREEYINNPDLVKDILSDGAKKMQKVANEKMSIVRDAVGIL
jgi:tryptophanyl-tRNA synthetase